MISRQGRPDWSGTQLPPKALAQVDHLSPMAKEKKATPGSRLNL